MRSTRWSAVLVMMFAAAACGDDGGSSPPVDAPKAVDAPMQQMDAPPQGTNALGQVCDQMTACPDGNACIILAGIGSQTRGYCSPACMNMNSICSTGYMGPVGSNQQCAVPEMNGQPPNRCVIVCQEQAECPTGLTCTQAPDQQFKVCVVAP